jgi:hypothetical protein
MSSRSTARGWRRIAAGFALASLPVTLGACAEEEEPAVGVEEGVGVGEEEAGVGVEEEED